MLINKQPLTSLLIGSTILLLIPGMAIASSPEAWRQHFKEVESSCIKKSNLSKAKPVGRVILFSDDVGYDALIIKGHYPQPHMKNALGKELCLFNKRTRKAETSSID